MILFLSLSTIVCAGPFDLIKKSPETFLREEFESVLGELTKYDFILISPENYLVSVIKVEGDQKITRKYWSFSLPRDKVKVSQFGNQEYIKLKEAVDKIFNNREKFRKDPPERGHFYLYKKASDNFSWQYVTFFFNMKESEFAFLADIMIPKEEISNEEDYEEFLRGIPK